MWGMSPPEAETMAENNINDNQVTYMTTALSMTRRQEHLIIMAFGDFRLGYGCLATTRHEPLRTGYLEPETSLFIHSRVLLYAWN